jgi:hypothetical protein
MPGYVRQRQPASAGHIADVNARNAGSATAFKTATTVDRTGGGVASGNAAMLIGMTPPPSGRDEDKARERRLRRSGEAGNRAGETAEPVEEAETRSPQLHEDDHAVNGGVETEHGSTPEQVRRADRLEERSYRHAQRARQMATEAHDRAAEAHGRAAQLHDRQADLGWGDVEEHREQAHQHRESEEADRAAADHVRGEDRGDGSGQPTPPMGPDIG